MADIKIITQHLRKLPDPQATNGKEDVVYFPARVRDLPVEELSAWKDVNPRDVKTSTSVYNKIKSTLEEAPERFYRRNRGITLSAQDVVFDPKTHTATIIFTDRRLHGVLDGAHTLHAAGEVKQNGVSDEAFVQLKVVTGLTSVEEVAEVAGGLNTSLAVDLKSLENLEGHFKPLKDALAGEPYAEKIAYKMNEQKAETKPVDVREILYYLALFDGQAYESPSQPSRLFGRKEGLVRHFSWECMKAKGENPPEAPMYDFHRLFRRAKDILLLRDQIEKEMIKPGYRFGKLKAKNSKGESISVKKKAIKKKHALVFLDQEVDDQLALGYLIPMLGGFRANVDWNKPKGGMSWKVPLEELLPLCAQSLAAAILAVHDREQRPEYVGRSSIAWEMCFNAVQTAILRYQLEKKSA
ncbi:hypothetical protein D7X74_31050 [Corallococcus sp. CA047B]|uniref:AIPR family protein n=1 Tax=Corallococcus sp. CA047B TaxID=2316729 RepID=UPI000EA214AA|nr:AIPR family protein [Corallococcus sp. CA047B]RKH08726.1 hypothetical protein D7X74_31050 [Corallococcus sp. CA047B]